MEHFNSVEEFKEYIIANPPKNYWIGAPGTQAYLWDYCYNYGIYATGWGDLGDYSEYKSKSELKKEGLGANDQNTIWSMCNDVQIGDVIFAREGKSKIIGMGVVKSDYKYDPKSNIIDKDGGFFYSIREVKWLKLDQELNILPKKYTPTLSSCSIGKEILFSKHNDTNKYQPYIDHLRHAHNIVLTGAPGTGKTFMAHKIAEAMNAETDFVQFHPSYDYTDFVEGLRPKKEGDGFERADGVFKIFCKKALAQQSDIVDNFEEIWSVLIDTLEREGSIMVPLLSDSRKMEIELNESGTGLVERAYENEEYKNKGEWMRGHSKFFTKEQLYRVYRGLKGVESGGHDTYRKAIIKELINKYGLKEYYKGEETKKERKDFVFIIDEINRGEISKIFGELFYAIDPGYRGEKGRVNTQYQNLVEEGDEFYKGFYVPENVYIIGTMNDIDRSVESMDFAIRRRFSWIEVTAEKSADNMEISEEKKKRMVALNNEIEKIEDLGKAYQIGGSYFLKDLTKEERWDYHLEPLLREYLRGRNDIDKTIEQLKSAYDGAYQNNG